MPAQFAGVCYSNNSDAVDMHYMQTEPFYVPQVNVTSNPVYFTFIQRSGVWKYEKHTITTTNGADATNWSVNAPVPTFPSCTVTNDPMTNFTDGITLGWGVATVMILTFLISRAIRNKY